jgi:hypothetical protein
MLLRHSVRGVKYLKKEKSTEIQVVAADSSSSPSRLLFRNSLLLILIPMEHTLPLPMKRIDLSQVVIFFDCIKD